MADRAPLVGMLNALPDQGQGVPLAGMPDFGQMNAPFGELSVPHYSPSQRLGNAAQDALQWLGAKPQTAKHLVEGLGGVLGLTPAAIPVAAADLIDAKSRGDVGGTAQAALGMIPGIGPEAKALVREAKGGLKLMHAPEGGIYTPDQFKPGEQYFKAQDPSGNTAAEMLVKIDGNTARIEDILNPAAPREEGVGTLGNQQLRSLLSQFKQQFPEVSKITGNRVSGARAGGGYDLGANNEIEVLLRKYGLAGAIPTGAISAGMLAQPTDQPAL